MARFKRKSRAKYQYPPGSASLSEFQREKRRHIRAAKKALWEVMGGAAWLPPLAVTQFMRAYHAFKAVDEATKRQNWKGYPRQ